MEGSLIVCRNIVTNRRKQIISSWRSLASLPIDAVTTAPTKADVIDEDSARWRRIGDTLEYKGSYVHSSITGSAAGSGVYLFPLPLGLSADTNKMPVGTTLASSIAGWAIAKGDAANNKPPGAGVVWMFDAQNLAMAVNDPRDSGNSVREVTDAIFHMNNTQTMYHFQAWIPIVGWSVRNI